jgi:hypothetical protein
MTERSTPLMTRAASCRRHAQERDIAEADGTGQTVREYLWLPNAGYAGTDLPVAVVGDVDTATPVVYYTHADQSLFCRFDSRAAIERGTIEPGPAGQDYRCVQNRCLGCRLASLRWRAFHHRIADARAPPSGPVVSARSRLALQLAPAFLLARLRQDMIQPRAATPSPIR